MKKLIFLKWEIIDSNDSKIKKSEIKKLQELAIADSFKKFKSEIKNLPYIKIISQIDTEFIIEYPDDKCDVAYNDLIKIDIIDIIDSILTLIKDKNIIKSEVSDEEHLENLNKRMEKYKK